MKKKATSEIIKIFNFYKLRAKVNLIDVSKKYTNIIISLKKFKEIAKSEHVKAQLFLAKKVQLYLVKMNEFMLIQDIKILEQKIITKIENTENIIKKLD